MNNSTEKIKLNGVNFDNGNIDKLIVRSESNYSWENSIYQFLENWFDQSEFILLETSGSTGTPKTIKLSKASMRNSAHMTNNYFELSKDISALLCLPASYIAGKMMLVRAIVGGYNLTTVKPTANPFENLHELIDFAAITPFQLFHSIESLKSKKVKKLIVGGSPISNMLESHAMNIPTALYETYGMTETCSHIALRRFNGLEKSNFFTVLNGISIHKDERHCLIIEAPHLLDSEIITNDIVEIISPKSFKWLGRYDSVINSGGVKIHPEQVEKKLENVISVGFFIGSIPDEQLGEKVVLFIESQSFTNQMIVDLKIYFQSSMN